MEALGLFDLLSPYFLAGVDLGPIFHALLSTVHVNQLDTCFDEKALPSGESPGWILPP
jgi:hypothetical protein